MPKFRTQNQLDDYNAKLKEAATRKLEYLASTPRHGLTSATREVVRRVMLDTDGVMMAHGKLWDIKAKSLGAGIYQLSLKERNV